MRATQRGILMLSLLLLVLCLGALAVSRDARRNGVLPLNRVRALTLRQNATTIVRRGAPVPQLQCTGGTGRAYASLVQTVQCLNRGRDTPRWRCDARLPVGLTLQNPRVACQGYSADDDRDVLLASCALQYELRGAPQRATRTAPPKRALEMARVESVLLSALDKSPARANMGTLALGVLAYAGVAISVLVLGYFLWSRQSQPEAADLELANTHYLYHAPPQPLRADELPVWDLSELDAWQALTHDAPQSE